MDPRWSLHLVTFNITYIWLALIFVPWKCIYSHCHPACFCCIVPIQYLYLCLLSSFPLTVPQFGSLYHYIYPVTVLTVITLARWMPLLLSFQSPSLSLPSPFSLPFKLPLCHSYVASFLPFFPSINPSWERVGNLFPVKNHFNFYNILWGKC